MWRRDWKTESWVLRLSRWVLRSAAPWVAYWLEREERVLKAERPGVRVRRVVIVGGLVGRYCKGVYREVHCLYNHRAYVRSVKSILPSRSVHK